ncbi:DciA family protein [Geminicoccaceae bacterium 1502E]|nr:DciA family protein [Geminicoccaceae bacterium 1502E]
MTQRTKTGQRSGGTHKVAALLGQLMTPAARRRGFAEASLLAQWEKIVGAGLAGRCQPHSVKFARGRDRDGTLLLQVRGGAALELQHMTPQIIQRVNTYFGFPAVRELRFVQAPLPARTSPIPRPPRQRPLAPEEVARVHEAVAPVADAELREALEALGRSLLGAGPMRRGRR